MNGTRNGFGHGSSVGIGAIVALALLSAGVARADVHRGAYFAPAPESEFVEARHSLAEVELKRQHGKLASISFALPEDLVGPDAAIYELEAKSTGPNGRIELRSAGGEIGAVCSGVDQPALSCVLDYQQGYGFGDKNEVAKFLKQKFKAQPALLKKKLEQSDAFLKDPDGVLVIFLK